MLTHASFQIPHTKATTGIHRSSPRDAHIEKLPPHLFAAEMYNTGRRYNEKTAARPRHAKVKKTNLHLGARPVS